jgi:hypothetical protein
LHQPEGIPGLQGGGIEGDFSLGDPSAGREAAIDLGSIRHFHHAVDDFSRRGQTPRDGRIGDRPLLSGGKGVLQVRIPEWGYGEGAATDLERDGRNVGVVQGDQHVAAFLVPILHHEIVGAPHFHGSPKAGIGGVADLPLVETLDRHAQILGVPPLVTFDGGRTAIKRDGCPDAGPFLHLHLQRGIELGEGPGEPPKDFGAALRGAGG